MANSKNVVFVYLGEKLPKYAEASIDLAKKYSGLSVSIVGNFKPSKNLKLKNIEFFNLHDFYNPNDFHEVVSSNFLPSNFRAGFWQKTLERFFVLEQFLKSSQSESFFHAELDQLLFRCDVLIEKINETHKQGIFFPHHNSELPIASVMYCNDQKAITSLISYAKHANNYLSDMQLLGMWSKENRESAHILPTVASEIYNSDFQRYISPKVLSLGELGGLVDGAQIGQWIGGIDPRNVPILEIPVNHHVDKEIPLLLTPNDFLQIKLDFNSINGHLLISFKDKKSINLYNLHLHSKLHKWLDKSKDPVEDVIKLANSKTPVALRFSRNQQILDFVLTKITQLIQNPMHVLVHVASLLGSTLNLRLNRRPSSKPFLSGDSFREISDVIFEKNSKSFQAQNLSTGCVVFCESDLVEEFVGIISQSNLSVKLILGNSDHNFDESKFNLFSTNNIQKVFAQNLVKELKKVSPLPIGLENVWRFKHGILLPFRIHRLFRRNRIPRIMWSFRATNVSERLQAAKELSKSDVADSVGSVGIFKHQSLLSKYSFVASPPGNGLDTHRTWEAMYLRCVPIVKRSFMTEEFERLGLPIWIVDSYEELVNLTEDDLKEKYEQIKPKFESEVLWFNYWENLIKNS